MIPELREALRFCELVAMSKHPHVLEGFIVAYLNLHPLGWKIGVQVFDDAFDLSYEIVEADLLRGARELAELIGSSAVPCDECFMLKCICERLSGRSTVDERS